MSLVFSLLLEKHLAGGVLVALALSEGLQAVLEAEGLEAVGELNGSAVELFLGELGLVVSGELDLEFDDELLAEGCALGSTETEVDLSHLEALLAV